MYIDPSTRDFVDTEDGEWEEIEDARTAVVCQLDSELDAWWGDPDAGSENAAIMRSDLPTAAALKNSSERALRKLQAAGLISDVFVVLDSEDNARGFAGFVLQWFDRSSNRPADLAYSPLGGKPV